MKTFEKLVAIGIMVVCGPSVWANGGAWRTGVVSTGNPGASNEGHLTDVTIEEENLTIDLHQEFADVEVRYRMHNTGSRVKQDFFFPVEKSTEDLDDYRITADGKELKWEAVAAVDKEERKNGNSTQGVNFFGGQPAIKSWKESRIPFSGGQTQDVVIRYKASYERKSWPVSDHGEIGAAVFSYALSPAATWKGAIGKGKVVVNVLHPEPHDVMIAKPTQRFAKVTDTRYEWNFQDLKPTLQDDIKITVYRGYEFFPVSYAQDADRHSEFPGEYMLYDDRNFLVHVAYDAVASSTLKPDGEHHYDVNNIKERGDRNHTWSEGVEGDGIGENISFRVKRPLPLDAILIIPGYGAKNGSSIFNDAPEMRKGNQDELWWQNNRVAQLEITLNGEYTFTAAIPDEIFHDPYPILVRGYTKPVSTIKLAIKGVHRGTVYQDTCISLVELRAKLTKKPKIQPAR
ncbi:MAG: hypothetical protein ACFUZC_18845 [Chthoniobacteraceae bacterium]